MITIFISIIIIIAIICIVILTFRYSSPILPSHGGGGASAYEMNLQFQIR